MVTVSKIDFHTKEQIDELLINDEDPYLITGNQSSFRNKIAYPIQLDDREHPPGWHFDKDWISLTPDWPTILDTSVIDYPRALGWKRHEVRRLQLSYPIGPEGFEYIGLGRCIRDAKYYDRPLQVPQLNQIYYLYKVDRRPVESNVKVRNLDKSWCTTGLKPEDPLSGDAVWDTPRFKLLPRLDSGLPTTGPQSYPLIFSERDLL